MSLAPCAVSAYEPDESQRLADENQAVPPIVRPASFKVGCPTPTGTP